MSDLKPCPFCGSEKVSLYPQTCRQSDPERLGDRAFPMARFGKCFAEVGGENFPRTYGETKSAALNWNKRAVDPAAIWREAIETAARQAKAALVANRIRNIHNPYEATE